MANPSQPILKYTGSATCVKGTPYLGSTFTLGNVMQMKTENVSVSLDGTDAFLISFDDYAYVDATVTYTFNKDCIVAFADMTEVV